jgi:hypothetical protein
MLNGAFSYGLTPIWRACAILVRVGTPPGLPAERVAVCAWAVPDVPGEDAAERARVRIANVRGDARDGPVGGFQQVAGLRDPSRLKVLERRSPGLLAEAAEHGPGTDVELAGEDGQVVAG